MSRPAAARRADRRRDRPADALVLPAEDVDRSRLEPIDLRTSCPDKGTVSDDWDVRVGDKLVEQAAWRYDHPLREVRPVAGRIASLSGRVDVRVGGEPPR